MTKSDLTDLLIATTNGGKIKELKAALHDLPLRFRLFSEFGGLQAVSEVGTTYEENAAGKALDYSRQSGLHALADDSGLEVDVLAKHPGVYSAHYGGCELSDRLRTEKLLSELEAFKASKRSARFICVMVLAAPAAAGSEKAKVLRVTKGVCSGRIARSLRGSNGFGYDPVFIPEGYEETFGELPAVIKNRISHRAQALLQMRGFIEGWIGKLDRVCGAS
jgi:non-canonical purine NTP pyrophosphatase (RdgB/HAM1 family)